MMWTKHDENTIEVKVGVVDTDTNKHLSISQTFSRTIIKWFFCKPPFDVHKSACNLLLKKRSDKNKACISVCMQFSQPYLLHIFQTTILIWFCGRYATIRVKRQSQILRTGKGTDCNFLKHSFCELAAVSDPTILHSCRSVPLTLAFPLKHERHTHLFLNLWCCLNSQCPFVIASVRLSSE